MADKLFQQHEEERVKAERKTADYNRSLRDLGNETSTRKSTTEKQDATFQKRKK